MPDPDDEKWASQGPGDDQADQETVPAPAYIKMRDGRFKSIKDCSPDELMAEAANRMIQAKELMDQGELLYKLAFREGPGTTGTTGTDDE